MTDKILIERAVLEQALEALEYAESKIFGRYDEELISEARTALVIALDAPHPEESAYQRGYMGGMAKGRRDAARDALEQSEPAVWYHKQWGEGDDIFYRPADEIPDGATPLYTHPQPRQPLTEEEIYNALRPISSSEFSCRAAVGLALDEYRAIEKAHGIE